MTDETTHSTDGTDQLRCPECGAFCGVVYRSQWGGEVERRSCIVCGLNPPKCSAEDGSCYGCKNDATHVGATEPNKREKPWCPDHAPDAAEQYPYAEVTA